ncbi:MAG: hypothetical protein HC895_21405 [Leptolyngbyaceae cyanobacterium SM1_3_5]|nr:hypothetical protein [Leptolyngbyaceae cyanobacterium SM1_3_5]
MTVQQETLIPQYLEKWRSIAFSTQAIDFEQAKESVAATYQSIGLAVPDILYCSSPAVLVEQLEAQLGHRLGSNARDYGVIYMADDLAESWQECEWNHVRCEIGYDLGNELIGKFQPLIDFHLDSVLETTVDAAEAAIDRALPPYLGHGSRCLPSRFRHRCFGVRV